MKLPLHDVMVNIMQFHSFTSFCPNFCFVQNLTPKQVSILKFPYYFLCAVDVLTANTLAFVQF